MDTALTIDRNERGRMGQRKTYPDGHPQYLKSIIHEKLSRVNSDSREGVNRAGTRLQGKVNEQLMDAIKRLDKHTLNMYTARRAGLGTRELSWIRLDVKKLLANGNGTRF
jgi:hypothetical protein